MTIERFRELRAVPLRGAGRALVAADETGTNGTFTFSASVPALFTIDRLAASG